MDPVSITDEVREFYQRHPYPPPVEDLGRYRERWNDTRRRLAEVDRSFADCLWRHNP